MDISIPNKIIELAVILGQQNNFQEILRLVTQKSAELINADISLILMINPRTHDTVKTIYAHGEEVDHHHFHMIHTNISGWVIKNNQSFISYSLKKDERFRKNLFKKSEGESAICVPLQVEGIIIGTLLILNKDRKRTFTLNDLNYLEKFAAVTSPFLRNVQKIQPFFSYPIPEESLLSKYQALCLLGKSRKFIELLQAIEAASRTDVRILLEGQSGTGKELIARAIHQLSIRHGHKFVAVDCGAIPANLLESELFGHVRGAFTGATTSRTGLMEEANGGTLFLDEITNLPADLQIKLLRVLQENEIRPLGSNQTKKVDVRIISASSAPLRQIVETGNFREDLFYRLHVYPISVPSLKDRVEDIPILANHFLSKFNKTQDKQLEGFHEELLEFMHHQMWSGNIRELENFVERLVTLSNHDMKILDNSILPKEYHKEIKRRESTIIEETSNSPLQEQINSFEAKIILEVLKKHNWNQSRAAHELRISEQTIRYKMNKLGINKSQGR